MTEQKKADEAKSASTVDVELSLSRSLPDTQEMPSACADARCPHGLSNVEFTLFDVRPAIF
jgi:hypothetical protein